MKCSTRVGFVALLITLMMALAGSAWADVNSVKQAITNYGLTPSDSGNTITVTGSVTKPANDVLELGDITGFTIDWTADLNVTGGSRPSDKKGMINFTNGTFNLTGGTIQLPPSASTFVDGIHANGAATVRVNGGAIKGSISNVCGFLAENATLIIDSGEINIPAGEMLFAKKLIVNDPNVLTGVAFTYDAATYDYAATAYGHTTKSPHFDSFNDDDTWWPNSILYVASSGATWDIEEVEADMTKIPTAVIAQMTVKSGSKVNFKKTNLKYKGKFDVEQGGELNIEDTSRLTIVGGTAANDGKININGTMINKDKLINNAAGVITNNSANTLDNQGRLTNKGTINNATTGKITNTGTIDNAGGTIKNDGTFQSAQSKEEMGGTVEGEVQPAGSSGGNGNGNGSGGSSGCNAGFDLLGLSLLAGLAVSKRRA